MSQPPVQLRLLTTPTLVVEGGGAPYLLQRKDAALLTVLALDGPMPRSRLTKLLWADATDDGARNNLRQRLFRLRRAAGRDVVVNESHLALGDSIPHDLHDVISALRANPAAARGELLGSFDYGKDEPLAAWVAAARRRWRTSVRDALMMVALDFERQGRTEAALTCALRLLEQDALDEPAAQLLLRLRLQSGERDAALAEFDRFVRALRHEHRSPSAETIALARLVAHSASTAFVAPAPMAMALRRPPRTVGRDAVFVAAERCWQDHDVVLLTGPAGIGKTRVFDELARRWRVCLKLQAAADDAADIHGLLSRLIAALLPHLPAEMAADDAAWLHWVAGQADEARPPGQMPPARLTGLMRVALAAAARQGVEAVAIDDLHFADQPSLAVLGALLPGLASSQETGEPTARMRWLLASRDAILPDELRSWLDRVDTRFDPVVPLPPLAPEHIGELLASVSTSTGANAGPLDTAAWAHRLDAHCGGHPLFLLQVLRELQHTHVELPAQPPPELPLPPETLAMVTRRLDRADAPTQQLAYVAALCGVDFDAGLATRLLRWSPAELLVPWRRLKELNVLDDAAFSHELVRLAVLRAVPVGVAALLHREIAEALRDNASAAGRRALHWEAAAAFAEAARDFTAAADEALARGLLARAAELLGRAGANHRNTGATGAAWMCDWRAGHLVLAASSAADAEAIAKRLLDAADEPAQKARALELLTRARSEQHDNSALRDAESALALAVGVGEPALIAMTRLALAGAQVLVGRHREALEALEALEAQIDLLDAQARSERAQLHSVALSNLGRRREAIAAESQSLAAAEASGDLAAAAGHAGNVALQLSYLGQVEEAIVVADRAVALGRRAGMDRGYVLVDEMMIAGNHADMGRFATALGMHERITEGLRRGGYVGWAVNSENDWAGAWLRLGRFDLAQRLLDNPPAAAPTWARVARCFAQGRLQQWRGGSALPCVQQAVSLFGQGGAVGSAHVHERIQLEFARWTSPNAALRRSATALRWARQINHAPLGWMAAWVRIEALFKLGRGQAAATSARDLIDDFAGDWRAMGFYLPELWLLLCDALAAGGEADAATALAAYGVRWIRDRATHDVPAAYRESFLQRNPFNHRLLNWRVP